MRGLPWLRDTIARRFAVTIFVAIAIAIALSAAATEVAGVWSRPSAEHLGLPNRVSDIVRLLEAFAPADRQAAADTIANDGFHVDWYPAASSIGVASAEDAAHAPLGDLLILDRNGRRRRLARPDPGSANPATAGAASTGLHAAAPTQPVADILSVEIGDGSWVVFTAPVRFWGVSQATKGGAKVAVMIMTVIGISVAAACQLSRPILRFNEAVRRFGNDPRAAVLPVAGPSELRETVHAFNAMQAKIQAFVSDRTAMLAAISHDLRTPLTKIRLRGEFIEDADQRSRLFRDVDDMQAMVDSALAFFRDDLQDEEATAFDFPELLRTIADDYADQGCHVAYHGVDHLALQGRPFALKRAFTNLVDNAVKYGEAPELELRCRGALVEVAVRDSGPGIPAVAFERVFAPFHRLERSRNRATGGVGLGLTSARSVIQGHGGTISLRNRDGGGLEVRVTLPA